MQFHYVDRILEIKDGSFIRGVKNVTRNEPFFYFLPTGQRVLSPAVVTESLAQLGSWLEIYISGFKKRPVLLADEYSSHNDLVEIGDQIDMRIWVTERDDDVIASRSEAYVNGQLLASSQCCRGYLLPLEDFSVEDDVRRQFKNLYRPGEEYVPYKPPEGSIRLSAIAGQQTWDALRFIDALVEHEPYKKVAGFKNFCASEPYFGTHFPRRPVVPGVLLMTFMGEVCQYLIKETYDAPLRERALIPTFIRNVRFRKFVEPGDQVILVAEVVEGNARRDSEDIVVRALMYANGKRVMQGEMGFRTMYGRSSRALDELKAATRVGTACDMMTTSL